MHKRSHAGGKRRSRTQRSLSTLQHSTSPTQLTIARRNGAENHVGALHRRSRVSSSMLDTACEAGSRWRNSDLVLGHLPQPQADHGHFGTAMEGHMRAFDRPRLRGTESATDRKTMAPPGHLRHPEDDSFIMRAAHTIERWEKEAAEVRCAPLALLMDAKPGPSTQPKNTFALQRPLCMQPRRGGVPEQSGRVK